MRSACSFWAGLAIPVGLSWLLSGCGRPSAAETNTGPPTVTVATPVKRVVTDYEDYTGRTASIESVTVTPRVTGYLDKIYFEEGTEVKEGTVLYEIDPRPYQAAFDQAKASVAQNQASLKLAKSNMGRYELAFKNKAVTAQDVDTYRSQEQQAAATLEASQANLKTAQLNLTWTKVTAPVTGRLGQTLVSRGNLVTADQTQLTTIVSLDPMYTYFDVDEATVEHIERLIREGKLKTSLPEEIQPPSSSGAPPAALSGNGSGPLAIATRELRERAGHMRKVFLGLADETGYPHVAYVDFFSNQIALSTATLQVRAIFWNPMPKVGPRLFTPGMFVRVRVPTSATYQALLVSQSAIGTTQNVKFVYVVNAQDEVEQHVVTLGGVQDGLQVIESGLAPSDRVIVDGLQHVHPGVKVNAKSEPMPVPAPDTQAKSPPGSQPQPEQRLQPAGPSPRKTGSANKSGKS